MRIFIWGTGRLVGMVVGRYIQIENVEAFIDNDRHKKSYMGKNVFLPMEIVNMEYDAICVCNVFSKEIYKQCIELGIDTNRVIFLYNNCSILDMNKNYDFIKNVLGQEYADIIQKRYHLIRGTEAYGNLFLTEEKWLGGGGMRKLIMSE